MSLTRDIERAKAAFKRGDVEAMRAAHAPDAGSYKEPHKTEGKYVKSLVYGGLDGIITTFAVVAGVAGASLSPGIVLIMGFANLIADGFAMAVGDYLSTKSENEYMRSERAREGWEVDNYPEGEKRELIELYMEKGIPQEDAESVVEIISRHKEAWLDIMMVEELGIVESDESPLRGAVATFCSFVTFGFVPLAAHLATTFNTDLRPRAFVIACVLTALTLFTLGALKVRITEKHWLLSGLEMLLVGGIAASAAYGIGHALKGLAG